MTLFRSLLFNAYFYILFIAMALVGLPLLALPWPWIMGYGRLWTKAVLFGLKVICGLDYRVRDRHRLPRSPCLVASKHQSAWETMVLTAVLLDRPSCVLKQELLSLPFFGWYLRRGRHIAIDRSGGAKALRRMVGEAKQSLAEGRSILIFPEGTRTAPGQRTDYHVGVAALYKALAVPVVPVALNSGLFWGRQSFYKRSGVITVQFLEPIPPGLPRETFMTMLHESIEAASEKLTAEGAASGR